MDLSGGAMTVNGRPAADAQLCDGDEIRAGATVFRVVLEGLEGTSAGDAVSESKDASSDAEPRRSISVAADSCRYRIGSWQFQSAPDAWTFEPDKGFRAVRPGEPPEFAQFSEHPLAPGTTLATLRSQLSVLDGMKNVRVLRPPGPIKIPGTDEALSVLVCWQHGSTPTRQRQIFVRRGWTLGIAMLTSLAGNAEQVEKLFDSFVDGISFAPAASEQHSGPSSRKECAHVSCGSHF
jgi:hypothetical protein